MPLLDRLVERALPPVEPNLPGRVGADDDDHGNASSARWFRQRELVSARSSVLS